MPRLYFTKLPSVPMLRFSTLALLAALLVLPAAQAQTVQAGLFYDGNTQTLSIRLKPDAGISGAFSNVVFTLRYPASSPLTLGPPQGSYGVIRDAGPATSGSYRYEIFAATPNVVVNWTAGQEVEIATIAVTGGTTELVEIAPQQFTTAGQGDYYFEINGFDQTNYATPYYAGSATLPVELTALEALHSHAGVVVRWETASETNNAGFSVEYRAAAAEALWQTAGFVEGNGTTAEAQQYAHTVAGLVPGAYRFRLKQVDFDGTEHLSPEVEVQVEMDAPFLLAPVHPNPFHTAARLTFAVRAPVPVTLALYNALGQQVRTLYSGTPEAGQAQTVRLEGADLPSGLYFVRLTGPGILATRQLTLVR